MRLGAYLGIFGTIFGNLLVASVLFMITSGAAYKNGPVLQKNTAIETPVSTGDTSSETVAFDDPNSDDINTAGEYISSDCEISSRFPDRVLQWCNLITHYARQRELPTDLVAALVLQESGGNPTAYSHSGAVGLMQVMPRDGLAASFMCKNGPCFSNRPSISELEDPEFNIAYGTRMLSSLRKKYGNIREALKAYGPMDVGYYYADIVLGHYERYGN